MATAPTPDSPKPARRPRGRPTKRSLDVDRRIVRALLGGCTYKGAAAAAGISYDTFLEWQRKYPDFSDLVEKAARRVEQRLLRYWLRQAPTDWRACRDLLARRYPDEWGPRAAVVATHQGNPDQPLVAITRIVDIPPDPGAIDGGDLDHDEE